MKEVKIPFWESYKIENITYDLFEGYNTNVEDIKFSLFGTKVYFDTDLSEKRIKEILIWLGVNL